MVQDAFNLKGQTVAITRPANQAEETGNLIRTCGGVPYMIPSITIKETCDAESVKHFVSELQSNKIDYILFMSVNGIRYLLSCTQRLGLKAQILECLKRVLVMAVGPKTADELRATNIGVDLVPIDYSSDGIVDCLKRQGVCGKNVWIPRTKGATPNLANSLRTLGAFVHELYVYESLLPHDPDLSQKFLNDLRAGLVDAIIFGSSLSAKNLFEMLEPSISQEQLRNLMNSKLTVVAIGPVTAQTLSEIGLRVDVMPETYLFKEALNALAKHWNLK